DSYLEYENQQYQGFGLGLILSHGDSFTVQSGISAKCSNHPLPQGLAFLQHYLLDEKQWTIHAPKQIWEWHKQ
ncbi:beta-ketoacyl synthase chain length factor, partial [Vibrio sp. YT-15]|uniref:beta-ketoacyl synthase chain length factor n=1 Tax=Vibrio sp. YT-15 TaxID=3074706 RepID=UPI002964857C